MGTDGVNLANILGHFNASEIEFIICVMEAQSKK